MGRWKGVDHRPVEAAREGFLGYVTAYAGEPDAADGICPSLLKKIALLRRCDGARGSPVVWTAPRRRR